MKIIFFSKDRPMQLEAFIDSFFFCAGPISQYITTDVYTIVSNENDYKDIINKYPQIHFIEDKIEGFDKTIRKLINSFKDHQNVLFGCDDQVYIRPINVSIASDYLNLKVNEDTVGFSLRLGTNIAPRPYNQHGDKVFFKWNWTEFGSHWGYPFELMGTVYRAPLLKDIINACDTEIKCPNFYESFGNTFLWRGKKEQPMMVMLNTPNYTVAQDVNRVQDYFDNKVQGTKEQSVDNLKELYNSGHRLDWANLFNISPSDIFVGNKYWRLKDQNENTSNS